MPDDQKTFWATLPGILTGVAAIITAIAGLYLAIGPEHKPPEEVPVTAPEPVHEKSSEIPAKRSMILIKARDFQRTENVAIEMSVHGQDLIQSADPNKPTGAEYDIMFPDDRQYRVWIHYAAAISRPVRVMFNGETVLEEALKPTTGGWGEEEDHWEWSHIGTVYPRKGKNTLKLFKKYRKVAHPHENPFPHIQAIKFEPID